MAIHPHVSSFILHPLCYVQVRPKGGETNIQSINQYHNIYFQVSIKFHFQCSLLTWSAPAQILTFSQHGYEEALILFNVLTTVSVIIRINFA